MENNIISRATKIIKEVEEEFEFYASKNEARTIFKSVELDENHEICFMAVEGEKSRICPEIVVTYEDLNSDNEEVLYSTSKLFEQGGSIEAVDEVLNRR